MKVRIVDWGCCYTTYDYWFKHYHLEEYLDRYIHGKGLFSDFRFGYIDPKTNKRVANHDFTNKNEHWLPCDEQGNLIDTSNVIYNVIASFSHTENPNQYVYLIEEPITNKIYLIERDGIKMIEEED